MSGAFGPISPYWTPGPGALGVVGPHQGSGALSIGTVPTFSFGFGLSSSFQIGSSPAFQSVIQLGGPPSLEIARYKGGSWEVFDVESGKLVATADASVVREAFLDALIAKNFEMIPCRWCRMPVLEKDMREHCRARADAGCRVHILADIIDA